MRSQPRHLGFSAGGLGAEGKAAGVWDAFGRPANAVERLPELSPRFSKASRRLAVLTPFWMRPTNPVGSPSRRVILFTVRPSDSEAR